jgi:MFS family permease
VVFLFALPTVFEKTRASHTAEAAEDASIKSAVPIFALTVVLAFLMYMPTVQGADVLKQKGITDPTVLSTVVMVMSIGTMATSFMFGAIRRRLGYLTIQTISFGLQGVGIAGIGLASNVVGLSALAFVAGLGSGFIQPLTQSEILAKVPPAASSRAVGLSMAALMGAQLLNPFLVKPLRASFGAENAFLYIGLAGIAAAVLTLAWRAREGLRRPATAE